MDHGGTRAAVGGLSEYVSLSPTGTLSDQPSMEGRAVDEAFPSRLPACLSLDDDPQVKGTRKHKSIMRHLGSGTSTKTITFRTPTEAEMNEAYENIKACIQAKGGMVDKSDSGYPVQVRWHRERNNGA